MLYVWQNSYWKCNCLSQNLKVQYSGNSLAGINKNGLKLTIQLEFIEQYPKKILSKLKYFPSKKLL